MTTSRSTDPSTPRRHREGVFAGLRCHCLTLASRAKAAVRLAERSGFRVVIAGRFAMYYGNESGRAVRFLFAPGVFAVARAEFRAAKLLGTPDRDRLVVAAVRP